MCIRDRYTGLLKRKGKKYLRRKNGRKDKYVDGMSVSFLTKTKQNRRTGENSELAAMAWRNLTRYKSRFVLTLLSLFLGMETFLAAVVITVGSDYAVSYTHLSGIIVICPISPLLGPSPLYTLLSMRMEPPILLLKLM